MYTFKGKLFVPLGLAVGLLVLLLLILQGMQPQVGLAKPLGDTAVSTDITTNTTWTVISSPYILQGDVVVTPGVTLTIEPGVVVEGQFNTHLRVRGHLEALGEATQPITFTSDLDSNRTQWEGLVFDGGTGHLQHVAVRYGGQNNGIARANIVVSGVLTGEVRIESSRVFSGGWGNQPDYGLYIQDSHVVVSDTSLIDNNVDDLIQFDDPDYALYATGDGTVITVTNSSFIDNKIAVRVEAGHLRRTWVTDNTFRDNVEDRVFIAGGALAASVILSPQNGLEGYVLGGNLIVSRGMTLTLRPDVTVMGWYDAELQVLGHLEAVGKASQPITFTSEENSGPNQWSGLVFDGGTGELRHATVRYGGGPNSVLGSGQGGNVTVRDVLTGQVRIESSRVLTESYLAGSGGWDYGLYLADSHVVVSDTTFSGNGDDSWDHALHATGDSTVLTITNSIFQNNGSVTKGWGFAARMAAGHLHHVQMAGNSFDGPGRNRRVLIAGGALAASAVLIPQTGLEGYVVESDLNVPAGITLTLRPDVTVMGWDDAELQVVGHLEAVGRASQPITFTSRENSGPYQWSGLVFDGGTGELHHATVRYGGRPNSVLGPGQGSNVTVRDVLTGQVRIESSRVLTESYNPGIGLGGTDYGLYVADGHVVVSGTTFSGNGDAKYPDYGLYATGAGTAVTITGSGFYTNGGYAVRVGADHLHHVQMEGNTFAGSDENRRVLIAGGALVASAVLSPQTGLEGYVLEGDLTVSGGGTLAVRPGVAVMGQQNTELEVVGHLEAVGTASQPITFTSGADSGPNQWSGLVFDGGTGELRHATVRYGGNENSLPEGDGTSVRSNVAARNVLAGQVLIESSRVISESYGGPNPLDYGLYITNSHVVLSGATFRGNGDSVDDYALYASGAGTVITISSGSAFESNSGYGVYLGGGQAMLSCAALLNNGNDGLHVTGGTISATVVGSQIDGNGDYGLFNSTGVTVVARYNWWGDASGPLGKDVGGSGPVDYDPWLSAPACVLDLALAKSDWPDPVYVEYPLTYTITVTNESPSPVTGIVLTDRLPSNVTFGSVVPGGSCSEESGVVTCTISSLEGRASTNVTILVTPSVAAEGTITNTAGVTTSDQFDARVVNNTATVSTTVKPRADLAVLKWDAPDPVGLDEPLTYTLVVTNYGPSEARGVVVTDDLPGSVNLISAPGCSGTDPVTCKLDTLAKGATATVSIVVTPTVPGTISNTVRVGGAQFDHWPDNDACAVTTTVGTADLWVQKFDRPDPVKVGYPLTYTIIVTNNGPNEATEVILTDTLPLSVVFETAIPSQGACNEAGPVTCTLGTLDLYATATVTITVRPTEAGTVTNEVHVESSEYDPDLSDSRDTEDTHVDPVADLVVAKHAWPEPVGLGEPLTYTFSVTNSGPSTATGIRLTDTLPSGVICGGITPGAGMDCGEKDGTVTCSLASLAQDATATAVIAVTPTVTGTVNNRVSAAGAGFDPDEVNNVAAVTTTVVPAADLAIVKGDMPDPVGVGETLTYTLTVINHGSSPATGVVVTDDLPAEVNLISAPGCNGTDPITCTLAPLTEGATALVTITVVPTAAGVITNTVEVGGAELDPHPEDNVAQARTTVGTADLQVAKSAASDPVLLGSPLTFTISITNGGPDVATGVHLTDTLPSGVTLESAVPSQGVCQGTSPFTCTLGTLDLHATATVTVVVGTLAEGSITNRVSVAGDQADPNTINSTATVSVTVDPAADLWVSKSVAPGAVKVGDTLTYTVIVTNKGPSQATGVTLTDTLPSSVILESAVPSQGACEETSPLTCILGTLDLHATATVTVVVGTLAEGSITNRVSVAGDQADPNTINSTATVSVTVDPAADLWISKSVAPGAVEVGDTLTYTVIVTNKGPSQATGVTLTDTLPLSVTDVLAVPSQGSCNEANGAVVCDLGDLAHDALAVVGIVLETTAEGRFTNGARVAGNEADPELSNNMDEVDAMVTRGERRIYLPLVLR